MASSFTMGLPTPAPSTEISAKPQDPTSNVDGSFELPPAALSPATSRDGNGSASLTSLSPTTTKTSTKSLAPKRKASNAGKTAAQEYVLPPPPTRSRKIIQMKPKSSKTDAGAESSTTTSTRKGQALLAPAPTTKSSTALNPTPTSVPSASTTTTTGGKRKQNATPAPTTAAGRKMARKTAHSLIERRRRSKMNEEFGVLKDMIPECKGQEMHKLAILQASIRYMRWLEENLSKLNAIHSQRGNSPTGTSPAQLRSDTSSPDSASDDTDMRDLPSIREALANHPQQHPGSQQPTPRIQPLHHYPPITTSIPLQPASASVSPQHDPMVYPFTLPPPLPASALSSPAILSRHQPGHMSASNLSMLTSPAISPMQMPEDHEATAALLMLNTDRRSWSGESKPKIQRTEASSSGASGRGMSVKDLLG